MTPLASTRALSLICRAYMALHKMQDKPQPGGFFRRGWLNEAKELLAKNGIHVPPATTPHQTIPAAKPAPVKPGRSATPDLRLVGSGGRLDVNDFGLHAGDSEEGA